MKRQGRILLSLLLGLALAGGLAWAENLTVLSLSEYHGHLLPDDDGVGGLAQVATIVRQVRSETGGNVLVLNSGDILIGTVMSSAFRGVPDIEAMNLIGFDALVLGNHEFDFGIDHMNMLEDLADFPFISTNLVGSYHLGVEPAVVKRVGGIGVAILGVTNPNLYQVTSAETRSLTLVDSVDIIQRATDAVRERVEVVIVVTHQTTSADFELLQSVEGVDLIVGGHTAGWNGMYLPSSSFDPSLPDGVAEVSTSGAVLVKAPSFTAAVSRVDLTIEGGEVVRHAAINIPVQGFDPDPEVAALAADYESRLSDRLSEVIGSAAVTLDGERGKVRTVETNLGNLIADGLRATFPQADIGFANGGGIRNTIAQGDITLGNILEVHPFGNTIVTFDLTGGQLLTALENSVSAVEDVSGRFLQVSGLTFSHDQSREPGSRVVSVEVGGAPLDLGASYTIVTNSFIAAGGDGYDVFTQGENLFDSQKLDADVLADYIGNLETVSPTVEGRIVNLAN